MGHESVQSASTRFLTGLLPLVSSHWSPPTSLRPPVSSHRSPPTSLRPPLHQLVQEVLLSCKQRGPRSSAATLTFPITLSSFRVPPWVIKRVEVKLEPLGPSQYGWVEEKEGKERKEFF